MIGLKVFVKNKVLKTVTVLIICIVLSFVWLWGGLDKLYLDTDIGRDLSEISKLWIGQSVIWLGPRFSVGLHSSPFYYYLFYIPILLSGGNAYSIIVFNIVLAASTLFLLGYLSIKKYGAWGALVPFILGLMPWFQEIAVHPGNGFTYAIFLLAFLTALWFKLPVILASFLLGVSLSMHPGAIFCLPLLLYELIKSKTSLKKWILSIFVFLLPFAPLIAFEIITKGYWIKQWLLESNYGVSFNTIPRHYLFGIIAIIWFTALLTLVQKRFGKVILALILIYFSVNMLVIPKPSVSARSISKIQGAVGELIDSGNIGKDDRLAVISLRTQDTKTPQADDYRFFLRVKGFQVEEATDYVKAENLIIFVEDKDLDWENWNSWETDQFGERQDPEIVNANEILIAIYKKEQ